MDSRKALVIAAAAMTFVVGALLPVTAFPTNYIVGDFDAWGVNGNYDTWAASMTGLVKAGDTIEFCYTEFVHNVVKVDEEGYNACDATNPLDMWDSGDDKVQLQAGTSFFICGLADHCSTRGMKFAITAIESDE